MNVILFCQIYREGMSEGHKEKSTLDELSRRACEAERTRDEAIVKMDAMQNEMKRMGMTLVHNITLLDLQVHDDIENNVTNLEN